MKTYIIGNIYCYFNTFMNLVDKSLKNLNLIFAKIYNIKGHSIPEDLIKFKKYCDTENIPREILRLLTHKWNKHAL